MPVFLSMGEASFPRGILFVYLPLNVSVSIVSWVGNVHLPDVVWLFVCAHVVCEFRIVHSFDWVLARFIFFFLFFLCSFEGSRYCSFGDVLCVCALHPLFVRTLVLVSLCVGVLL